MNPKVRDLISAARDIQGKFLLADDLTAGSVGSALLTRSGKVFTGICLNLTCGLGFCAERAAAAEMLKHRETQVELIVAVGKSSILPPCGCCREMLAQIDVRNMNTGIILNDETVVSLRELLPSHWFIP